MTKQPPTIHSQRGVALFVGLMFLLVLTLLGLSASQGSIMQERMAGNVSDANVAFQRAEGTLRLIEERLIRHIEGGTGALGYMPPTWDEIGLSRNDCTMSGFTWEGSGWWKGTADGGEYIVIDLSDYMDSGLPYGSSCRPLSESGGATAGEYYLLAARSAGPSGTSESVVQSIFYWPN